MRLFPKTLLKGAPAAARPAELTLQPGGACVRWFPKGLETVEKVQRLFFVLAVVLPGRALVAGWRQRNRTKAF